MRKPLDPLTILVVWILAADLAIQLEHWSTLTVAGIGIFIGVVRVVVALREA